MRKVVYYDYQETFGEMVSRNLEKMLSAVTVIFVFTVFVIVLHGSMEIEKREWDLRMTQITNSIQRLDHTEKPITIEKTERLVTQEFEETEEVQEVQEEIKEEVTETAIASIKILSAEEIIEAKAINYNPTAEEREMAYKVAFAEASIESSMGQTLVINVAINNMRKHGYTSLMQEFQAGRYSSIVDGVVYNEGKAVEIENVPQSVKDAVEEAFNNDYTEEALKAEAEKLGITDSKYWEGGATYFCAPSCSGRENVKVKFQLGNHMFYRYWDK
ncbi:MAG: hypothetical protein K2H53_01930 [Clostridia bacterium]|nr:hypothetical protein [Clostridia bacterium]